MVDCPKCRLLFTAWEYEQLADELPHRAPNGLDPAPPLVTPAPPRRCPLCDEPIQPAARKCPHCGEILDRSLRERRAAEVWEARDRRAAQKYRIGSPDFWGMASLGALLA